MALEVDFMSSAVRLFLNYSVYAQAVARSFAQNELFFQSDALNLHCGLRLLVDLQDGLHVESYCVW